MASDLQAEVRRTAAGARVEAASVFLSAKGQRDLPEAAPVGGGPDGGGDVHKQLHGRCGRHRSAGSGQIFVGFGHGRVGVPGGPTVVELGPHGRRNGGVATEI